MEEATISKDTIEAGVGLIPGFSPSNLDPNRNVNEGIKVNSEDQKLVAVSPVTCVKADHIGKMQIEGSLVSTAEPAMEEAAISKNEGIKFNSEDQKLVAVSPVMCVKADHIGKMQIEGSLVSTAEPAMEDAAISKDTIEAGVGLIPWSGPSNLDPNRNVNDGIKVNSEDQKLVAVSPVMCVKADYIGKMQIEGSLVSTAEPVMEKTMLAMEEATISKGTIEAGVGLVPWSGPSNLDPNRDVEKGVYEQTPPNLRATPGYPIIQLFWLFITTTIFCWVMFCAMAFVMLQDDEHHIFRDEFSGYSWTFIYYFVSALTGVFALFGFVWMWFCKSFDVERNHRLPKKYGSCVGLIISSRLNFLVVIYLQTKGGLAREDAMRVKEGMKLLVNAIIGFLRVRENKVWLHSRRIPLPASRTVHSS